MRLLLAVVMFVAGTTAVFCGVWVIYPPAAWILAGATAVAVGLRLET